MPATLQATVGLNGQKEYLTTFEGNALGTALITLTDLGVTREIRCYPGGRMLLLEGELDALRGRGVAVDQAIPVE